MLEFQEENGLLNLAVAHNDMPHGVSEMYNIQFDHIPPRSSYDTDEKIDFGPSLAISNFDHRSEVWKHCSTCSPPIHELYKHFMKEFKYHCAIFMNLKCIRDAETDLKKKEYPIVHTETAFDRYKDGFMGIVDLHFDYGLNHNGAYTTNTNSKRPFPAYIEIHPIDLKKRHTPRSICTKKKYEGCCKFEKKYENYYILMEKVKKSTRLQ